MSEVAYQLGEVEYLQPNGTFRTALLSAIPVNETLLFGIAHDITEVMESKQRIEHLAFFDALTTLPNRALLAERDSIEFLMGVWISQRYFNDIGAIDTLAVDLRS